MTAAEPVRIFAARRVLTPEPTAADALVTRGGLVEATGRAAELADRFPDAERIGLGPAVVAPGFHDAHMHPAIAAENLLHLDASPAVVSSLADLRRLIADEAAEVTEGEWIQASRYDNTKMSESRDLDRADLDRAAPRHPVLVVHVASHWGVLNSEGLRRAGIADGDPDPQGGGYGRDAAGRLNGVVYEQALFDVAFPALAQGTATVPASSLEARIGGLRRALDMFHAAGLTSVGDALVGPEDVVLYQAADARGALTMRADLFVPHRHRTLLRDVDLNGSHLRFGGVKLFVDGAIAGRTCLVEQPFEDTDDHGLQTVDTDVLATQIHDVHRAGDRLAVHANGDRAIGLLLDLLERAQSETVQPGLRHRIEHCSIVTPELVSRIRALGAVAVPFGSYVAHHGEKLLPWYGADRLERMFAHGWFVAGDVDVAGSSDYPCAPYEPLLGLQSCVTRRGSDGTLLGGSQRIGVLDALRIYTVGSAIAADEAHVKGRLAPGFLADFVVLDDDPLQVPPETLASLQVLQTYVGGERVWPR